MKILIFGGKGYFGQEFKKVYPDAVASDADIADPAEIANILEHEKPDTVINCAGKTGRPNVDWCEDHKMETLRSNVVGPLVLLEECAKRNIYFVQMGKGCIYEGNNHGKGFSESDPPNFFGSFYSRSKGWLDHILREFPVLLLRLRMPFDDVPHDRNLITKLAKYPGVIDIENSLTYVPDFMRAARFLVQKRAIGLYNIVNPGSFTGYKIMKLYKEIVDPSHTFEKIPLEDLLKRVKAGRSNCTLSMEKLTREGITLMPIEQAVRKALHAYKEAYVSQYAP